MARHILTRTTASVNIDSADASTSSNSSNQSPREFGSGRYSQSPPSNSGFVAQSLFYQKAAAWEQAHADTNIDSPNRPNTPYVGNIRKHRGKVSSYIEALATTSRHHNDVELFNFYLHTEGNVRFKVYVYRPKDTEWQQKTWPTIIYLGGNGYVNQNHANYVGSELAHCSKMQVISIRHRLAPEKGGIFPAPLVDCHEQIKQIMQGTTDISLAIDAENSFLLGYSSGATTALSIAIESGLNFKRIIAMSPVTDYSRSLSEESFSLQLPINLQRNSVIIPNKCLQTTPRLSNAKQTDPVVKEGLFHLFRSAYVPNNSSLTNNTDALPLGNMHYQNPVLSLIFREDADLRKMPATDLWINNIDLFYNDAAALGIRLQGLHGAEHVRFFEWHSPFGHGYVWQDPGVLAAVAESITEMCSNALVQRHYRSRQCLFGMADLQDHDDRHGARHNDIGINEHTYATPPLFFDHEDDESEDDESEDNATTPIDEDNSSYNLRFGRGGRSK